MTSYLTLALQNMTKAMFIALVIFLCPLAMAHAEVISQYEVDIEPHADGSFSVTETIYYDFGRSYRHGIIRSIPTIHPLPSSSFLNDRYLDVELSGVTRDNELEPFVTNAESTELFIKVGEENQTYTSEHKYIIRYTVTGGLHYFDDGLIELNWDAIGTEWIVPIDNAKVTVTDPHNLLTGVSSCYVGNSGSSQSCGDATKEGVSYIYTAGNLAPGQGVTVAFAVKEIVPKIVLERFRWELIVIPLILVALTGLVIWAYRFRTYYKTRRTIVAQYEPYANLKPMYTGVLLDDTLHPSDITAGLLYLAQKGYLKIKKTERKVLFVFEVDDYEVILTKALDETLTRFQKDILKLLFSDLTVGEVVTLSELKSNLGKQKENHTRLSQLRADIKADLVEQGYYQRLTLKNFWPQIVLAAGITGVVALWAMNMAILTAVVTTLVVLFVSRRRTRRGYEALDHLKGFKLFLSVTDAERFAFHNAPSKSPEQFMEYLPYAIALGVEQEWSDVFKDITIPNPDWYDGDSAALFSATNLTSSLGAFSTALASSSGSSGGGSSGGGGSVGGGGGGGGGGSW